MSVSPSSADDVKMFHFVCVSLISSLAKEIRGEEVTTLYQSDVTGTLPSLRWHQTGTVGIVCLDELALQLDKQYLYRSNCGTLVELAILWVWWGGVVVGGLEQET